MKHASIEEEQKIIALMIGLYCQKVHGSKKGIVCHECEALLDYAKLRISNCPFKEKKGFCSNCKIHCYQPDMREKIRKVMRYMGMRMIFYNPKLVIAHIIARLGRKS